ncbi:MAG: response regulator [Bdellovibrionales bacterium]|nr:response regulator [Bdellovibrionales bacterium]
MSSMLIVDDSPDNRSFCELIAQMFNFSPVAVASDADEAIALIEKGFKPTVVLLDLIMPGSDPEELVKAIRAKPELDETEVVLMSAIREVSKVARTMGADDAIRKPFAMEKLVDRFRRFSIGP